MNEELITQKLDLLVDKTNEVKEDIKELRKEIKDEIKEVKRYEYLIETCNISYVFTNE